MNREGATSRKSISLVLGSGGARGYAHIGVIEELLAQGYEIRSVGASQSASAYAGISYPKVVIHDVAAYLVAIIT